jgi:hypothetical protein
MHPSRKIRQERKPQIAAGLAEVVREEGDEAGDGDEAAGGASERERTVEMTGVVLRQTDRGWKAYTDFYGCCPRCDIAEALHHT